jgi:formate dehydrogenase maturation protein FdhE
MGALRPDQAAIDAALARGYARGLEEARMDALDRWRTMLMTMLEAKFGELSTESLDQIEEASEHTIERWIVAVLAAQSLQEVFGIE